MTIETASERARDLIPVNEPLIGAREAAYVADCMASGWISSEGPYVERFERAWAAYCGVAHGVAMSSGTAALYAAVDALCLSPGDEVIIPSFTIISCAWAVIAAGGVPVLVDADPHTWCIDVTQVETRVTPRTRAIMAVHIYGHPVDMEPLRAIARRHGLAFIEDAAEAHGARYRGRRAGSLGDVACFSFYANKIITTGEGGMLVTNDAVIADRARSYRNLAFRPERRFRHREFGQNFRMTAVQAAIGLAQVQDADARVARKREIGRRYDARLAGVDGVQLPAEEPWAENVYWMYGVVLDPARGIDAETFAQRLRARGVGTRPFFVGMHEQPVLLERGLFSCEQHPVTERISRYGLYLPTGLTLGDGEIDHVATVVREEVAR